MQEPRVAGRARGLSGPATEGLENASRARGRGWTRRRAEACPRQGQGPPTPPAAQLPNRPTAPFQVPNERISLLRDKNAPGGLPSTKGLAMVGVSSLAWIPTHGHSPGHVSYLHQASGTVVAGDAAMLWQPALVLGGGEARGARGRPAGAARERLMAVTASVIASAGER